MESSNIPAVKKLAASAMNAEGSADGEHRPPRRRYHCRRRGEILLVDDVGHTGLCRRSEEGAEQRDSTLGDEDHPRQPRPGEQEQKRRRRLGERHHDQNPAAVEPIRHRARERTHHKGRQALGDPEQRCQKIGSCRVEQQTDGRDSREPVARITDHQGGEQSAKRRVTSE
jgi:hypothetical protein